VQLVETRGAAIAALQSEMSATIESSLGSKAADIISKERKRIEPHVTSLVQAVRASEGRVQQLQEELKLSQNQLLQLQHSVMMTNITQSPGSKRPTSASSRPSSASSRGSAAPIPESEAAARVFQAQADSLKMQVKELESESQQMRKELMSKEDSINSLSAQLDCAKREASDSQALVASLKAMANGGADAVSSAAEKATMKQELSRCQETINRLMNQESASSQTISTLQTELEAKMDQIDELKGQIMTALLKNRELSLEVEAIQSELRDKEQELCNMQNYVSTLEAGGEDGGGEGSFLMAEAERLRAEGEYKA
jgi:chromosome segregation ATPase